MIVVTCRTRNLTRESDGLPHFAGKLVTFVYARLAILPANIDAIRVSQVKR